MSQVEDLIWWPIDFAFDARVAATPAWLEFENGTRNVLIALQALVEIAIYDEGFIGEETPDADGTAVLAGVECVP